MIALAGDGTIELAADSAELILGERVGPWVSGITEAGLYALLGALAAVKAMVPPLPADSLVMVAAMLVVQGGGRLSLALAATCAGGVLGVVAVYEGSRRLGQGRGRPALLQRALRADHADRLTRLQARYGVWAYFIGRFLPGLRHVLPLFAGVAGAPRRTALVPLCAATVLWYGALVITGGVAGEAIVRALQEERMPVAAIVLLAVAVGVLIYLYLRGWRQIRRAKESG